MAKPKIKITRKRRIKKVNINKLPDVEDLGEITDYYKSINLTNDDIIKSVNYVYEPECVRKKANMSIEAKEFKFDKPEFKPEELLSKIPEFSPKLDVLLKRIDALDRRDMQKDGKKYKHFIFSDVKYNGYGVKLITSALMAKGMQLAYTAEYTGEEGSATPESASVKSSSSSRSSRSSATPKTASLPSAVSSKIFDEDEEDEDEDEYMEGGAKDDDDKESDYEEIDDYDEEEEEESGKEKKKKQYKKIEFLTDEELEKNKGNNFFLLTSISLYDQTINVSMKKRILGTFNKRPDNIYGDLARIIIMDSGFKEGIDLFDIKYIHIFEPSVSPSDQKQVIGRGTRTCGQKGLVFHPTRGWPLYVYIYDAEIPERLRTNFMGSKSLFDLFLKSMNLDLRLYQFQAELEKTVVFGSVDYDLNKAIHHFSIAMDETNDLDGFMLGGGKSQSYANVVTKGNLQNLLESNRPNKFEEVKKNIMKNFSQYMWTDIKMENLCGPPPTKSGGASKSGSSASASASASSASASSFQNNIFLKKEREKSLLQYTPTQNFIRNYFTADLPIKGMLLWHSVGTGKTCTAIASATYSFEREGYTILWVTRTTLKSDIWKNMFDQICSDNLRMRIIDENLKIPAEMNQRMALLSKSWKIRPISYKQFSNLISKKNKYYSDMVAINGPHDPLRKTLIIIDEAHKLYGGADLSSIERPDMGALEKALQNSYVVSGQDSVKVLLMTATPITDNPMEMVKLINLFKLRDEKMPDDFETFSAQYLDGSGGFTKEGEKRFLNQIAGHVSYLNREKDARQFSQPIIEMVNVPAVKDMDNYLRFNSKYYKNMEEEKTGSMKAELLANNERIRKENANFDISKLREELKAPCSKLEGDEKIECLKNAIDEVNRRKKEYTDQMKELKKINTELRKSTTGVSKEIKKDLERVKENIEKYPVEYLKYKDSLLASLQKKCSMAVRSTNLQSFVDQYPTMVALDQGIKNYENEVAKIKGEYKDEVEIYGNRIMQLRDELKVPNLTMDKKYELKGELKATQTNLKEVKANTKSIRKQISQINGTRKNMEKTKKALYKKLTKTLKAYLKNDKREKNMNVKEQKKLLKLQKKQDDAAAKLELKEMKAQLKVTRKAATMKARQEAKAEQAAAKKEAAAVKADENAAKKAQAAAKKAQAAAEKEREAAAKKAEKEREAAAKKAEKEREAAAKKVAKEAAKKTMKNRGGSKPKCTTKTRRVKGT